MLPPPPRSTLFPYTTLFRSFALVAVWSGHLDQADGVMMDISPASNGNTAELPATFEELPAFYDLLNGRSEEHTSELQSRLHLVCRLLLEKKKKKRISYQHRT